MEEKENLESTPAPVPDESQEKKTGHGMKRYISTEYIIILLACIAVILKYGFITGILGILAVFSVLLGVVWGIEKFSSKGSR